jgi:hypothetical protein
MAGITQTFTTAITDDAGRVVATKAKAVTGDSEEEFNVSCPGSSNVAVPLSIVQAGMVSFWVVADAADVTMTVNDDGSPDLTVVLVANVPYFWNADMGDNPITDDLAGASALKFTKSSAGAATVKGAFLST